MSTAKSMVVGCVQHYSTHFIKKLGKSLEPFFHKVQQNKNKNKMPILEKCIQNIRKKCSSPYGALTSCQVSKKSLERLAE